MTNIDAFTSLKTKAQCACPMITVYLLIKVENPFWGAYIYGSASFGFLTQKNENWFSFS